MVELFLVDELMKAEELSLCITGKNATHCDIRSGPDPDVFGPPGSGSDVAPDPDPIINKQKNEEKP